MSLLEERIKTATEVNGKIRKLKDEQMMLHRRIIRLSKSDFTETTFKEALKIKKQVEDNQIRIKDLYATATSLFADVDFTCEYYDKCVSTFFKNAVFKGTSLEDYYTEATPTKADIYFENNGMFYSWSDDKGIKLTVTITSSDGIAASNQTISLDTTKDQNAPGEETSNQDNGRVKSFEVSIPPTLSVGSYEMEMQVIDNDGETYCDPVAAIIRIIGKEDTV